MGQSQSTEMQVFSGGINLVPAAHLIQPNESRFLSGADVRTGNLTPFLDKLFVEEATGEYMYWYNANFEYYNVFRSNVLYNKIWYWTSVFSAGKMYSDGTELPLGIEPPVSVPVASIQNAVDKLEGSINYLYTYYDPKSGSESPPSRPSNTVDLVGVDAGKKVYIANMTESPDGLQIRLYRIGRFITAYSAVVTLPVGVNTYTDELSFSEIEGTILDTLRAFPPPAGLQNLALSRGRFFGSVGSNLYFTPPGKPDSWYALDFLSFEDTITMVTAVATGVIVCSEYKSWVLTGIAPEQFSIQLLSDSDGCVSQVTSAVDAGNAIWLSHNGFVVSNGSSINNMTLNKIGRTVGLDPIGAVLLDKRYIMSFTGSMYPNNGLVPSESLLPGTVMTDNGVGLRKGAIIIDLISSPSVTTIADEEMGYIVQAENRVMQISKSGDSAEVLLLENTDILVTENGVNNLEVEVPFRSTLSICFEGDKRRELLYVSPVLTEGSINSQKQYEKVRITYLGEGVITIYDEDSRVFATQQLSSLRTISVWVNIPVVNNRGYGIQFKVVGKLTVSSIQWIWTIKEAQ